MEGEKFSSFARSYLKKRPRLSPTHYVLDDAVPSTSYASETLSTPMRKTDVRPILIEPSDEQLLNWQEQQISKCIVDNTVNRVVESYLTFFEEENANTSTSNNVVDLEQHAHAHINSYHAFRNHQNFEESYAILRAIDEIGLQHNNEISDIMSTSSSSISISSPIPSPSNPDLSFDCESKTNVDETQTDSNKISNQTSELNEANTSTNHRQDGIRNSSTTYHSNQHSTAARDRDDTLIDNEHFEFIETAVSVAIQEKGLSKISPKR